MDQVLSWYLPMKISTLHPEGDLSQDAPRTDTREGQVPSQIAHNSKLDSCSEEPLSQPFFKEWGRLAQLKQVFPICLYNIQCRYFNSPSYNCKSTTVLHKYLQLAIGFYAVKNIFSSSHAQGSLTSIISHCQKVTKHIPRGFIHQSSLQKLLFPFSVKESLTCPS